MKIWPLGIVLSNEKDVSARFGKQSTRIIHKRHLDCISKPWEYYGNVVCFLLLTKESGRNNLIAVANDI